MISPDAYAVILPLALLAVGLLLGALLTRRWALILLGWALGFAILVAAIVAGPIVLWIVFLSPSWQGGALLFVVAMAISGLAGVFAGQGLQRALKARQAARERRLYRDQQPFDRS